MRAGVAMNLGEAALEVAASQVAIELALHELRHVPLSLSCGREESPSIAGR